METCVALESDNEWAGSVDTINVFFPWFANHNAVAEEIEVFPTPPFPPTKMNVVSPCLNLNKSLNAI